MTKKIYAYTLGVLLAIMLVPAGVARADQTDADFANYLASHGIHLGTQAQAVSMARTMCSDLEGGYTQKDEVDQLTGSDKLTPDQAAIFIGAATADYCPAKHQPSPPRGDG